MTPIIRNIVAGVAGVIGGSIANMALIQTGHALLPIPGVDPNDMDALAAAMPSLTFEYFIFPFSAHAVGTLSGALLAGWIATHRKMLFALIIGGFFLLGGIWVNYILPGPFWFSAIDLLTAYIPMAWMGGKIALNISRKK